MLAQVVNKDQRYEWMFVYNSDYLTLSRLLQENVTNGYFTQNVRLHLEFQITRTIIMCERNSPDKYLMKCFRFYCVHFACSCGCMRTRIDHRHESFMIFLVS